MPGHLWEHVDGAFGLRCSEALALQREDICLGAATPQVVIARHTLGSKMSPGEVYSESTTWA